MSALSLPSLRVHVLLHIFPPLHFAYSTTTFELRSFGVLVYFPRHRTKFIRMSTIEIKKTLSGHALSRMYSPARKVRASVRRTICLLLIGCISGFLLIETLMQVGKEPSTTTQFPPTRSAGVMLTRSQMLLAKEAILEPTIFTCSSEMNGSNSSSNRYPLYIIVKTRAAITGDYYQRRMFTRISWGQEAQALGIPVIYAVGRPNDEQIQTILENEHRTYGDLLQLNYIDAYYNISIKSSGILHWFVKRGCQHRTPYLFVVDDDILINLPSLMKMIEQNLFDFNTLYGLYLTDIEPHPAGKWAVSLTDYPNRTFPSFITGASTLYPSGIVHRLVDQIFHLVDDNQLIFFLDDVLITGLIADQVGIQRAPLTGIEDCSYTDLFSRTIISECSNLRRTYVWLKYIFSRLGQTSFEIDRLITSRTRYIKWQGNFQSMRNGTAILPEHRFDSRILMILFDYHPTMSLVALFILLFVFISIFIPKFIASRQSISTNKFPVTTSSTTTSPSNHSLRLLATIKN